MNASGEPRMDLEKLRELEAAATPGPWLFSGDIESVPVTIATCAYAPDIRRGDSWERNAAFIVAAVSYVRSILSQPETLDAAWKEAEAALPEGESIGVTSTVGVTAGRYVATTSYGPPGRGFVYADSPAAALRNLATRLKEGKE